MMFEASSDLQKSGRIIIEYEKQDQQGKAAFNERKLIYNIKVLI
jgi:hypothetical protein